MKSRLLVTMMAACSWCSAIVFMPLHADRTPPHPVTSTAAALRQERCGSCRCGKTVFPAPPSAAATKGAAALVIYYCRNAKNAMAHLCVSYENDSQVAWLQGVGTASVFSALAKPGAEPIVR